jgi:hypothetical protein
MLLQFFRENIRHFTCDLVLLLGKKKPLEVKLQPTYLHTTLVSQAKGVNCIGCERRDSRPCPRPQYISLYFICTSSRQAIIVSPLKWSMLRVFHCHDYISLPCAHFHLQTFHLGSTIVAATKIRPSAVKPYFCHKHLLLTPTLIFFSFHFPNIFTNHRNICARIQTMCGRAKVQTAHHCAGPISNPRHSSHATSFPLKEGYKME